LSQGSVLQIPLRDPQTRTMPRQDREKIQTLADAEREHILGALRKADWVLSGPNGAATHLGINRSTLQFRMRKLGIVRPSVMWVEA
jgi:formate hydrogenlyase transcriptional activator